MTEVSFGEWLKRQRMGRGLTRNQLAHQIGCAAITLRKIEAEERRPSAQIVERLTEIFKIPPNEKIDFISFSRGDWTKVPGEQRGETPWRATTQSPRTNLRTPLTSFIGRHKEVADVREYTSNPETRLVTLVGPPGIGKTRLSLAVARESLSKFTDGVFFVGLAPLEDPKLVALTVAQTLGFVETPDRSSSEQLKDELGDKHILVILDNVEHVLDTTAILVSDLLSACPYLKVLATSREAIRSPGEWLYPVPALHIPTPTELQSIDMDELSHFSAIKLFAERGRAARPDFKLNADNVSAITAICSQLDGLPLAIELIAARLRWMSAQALLSQLTDQLVLSTDGMRAVPARQKNLLNAIGWSYNLLSEEEGTVLRRLSVFMGGWTLEAAGSVCDAPNMFDLLTNLVDKSLVAVDLEYGDEPRYYLLETIRQYAREKLNESGEGEIVRQEHSQWFLKLAEKAKPELVGPNQKIWFERLDREKDNFRSALYWLVENNLEAAAQLASGLFWFWHAYCYWSEGRDWYDRLLKPGMDVHGQKSLTPAMRAQVLYEAGWLAIDEMDTNQARSMSEQSLALYRKLGDKGGMAMAIHTLSWIAYYLNEYSDARTLAEESLTLFKEVGLISKFESVLNLLGHLARVQGSYDQAIEFYKESLKWSGETGNKSAIAYTLCAWGWSAWFRGDLEQAKTLSEDALRFSREIRLEWNVAEALTTLGDIARVEGEYQEAANFYGESNDIWRRLGNQRERGYLLWSRGWLARLQDNHKQATDFFNEGLILWREVGDQRHIAECLEGLAGVNIDVGKTELAAQLMGKAEMIREDTNSPLPRVDHANYDQDVVSMRSQLGQSNFQKAWAEGRELTVEQAIDLALQRRS